MRVLMIDGHPDAGRLSQTLLESYAAGLGADCVITTIAVRDLEFADAKWGFARPQPWERDLVRVAEALAACDHLVIAFPMWWGAEPAMLKAFIDRLLMPGFAFNQHKDDPWWDGHLKGRSADLIVTMDTPRFFLKLAYGNAIWRRWKGQVLGYCGIRPVRFFPLGPVRQGGVERNLAKWRRTLVAAAGSAASLTRGSKTDIADAYIHKIAGETNRE